jgi:GDPmannose 4,6-dehydratase
VRYFIEKAFSEVGIEVEWKGEGVNEKGYNKANGEIIVEVDPKYFRPTEVDLLVGDPSKAHRELGWKHRYSLDELIKEMVEGDMQLFKRDKYLLEGGHDILDYNE